MLGIGLGLGTPCRVLNRGKWSQAEALVKGGSSFLHPLSRQKVEYSRKDTS